MHRALADVVLHPRRVAGRALDDEPRLDVAGGAGAPRGGVQAGGVGRGAGAAGGTARRGGAAQVRSALRETHSRNR